MSPLRSGPHNLQGLPTLTEVIELPAAPERIDSAEESAQQFAPPAAPQALIQVDADGLPGPSEEQLVQRVLTDLQRHTDLMLEYRLREALTPALARLADTLVRDLRQELATTLRDVVERAVSQELARQRGR